MIKSVQRAARVAVNVQLWCVLTCCVVLAGFAPAALSQTSENFVLVDWLGRQWTNERVRFPVTPEIVSKVSVGASLVDSQGRPTPFEIVKDAKGTAIEFMADLPKFGRATYSLRQGVSPAKSDLVVEERNGEIRISNGKGGIAIRTRLSGDQGPISAVKLSGGQWIGSSKLNLGADRVTAYTATLERRGPVAATILCRTTFASGVTAELRVTMLANDPAVLVEEAWSDWTHPELEIALGSEFPASKIYFRKGAGSQVGQVTVAPVQPPTGDRVFDLEPWLKWWLGERRGNWVAAYADTLSDTVVVGALRGDTWIDETDVPKGRTVEPIAIKAVNSELRVVLPKNGARRRWFLAALPRAEAIDLSVVGKLIAPPPQQLVIRHGDFPLDRIKDLVLTWQRSEKERPRLFLTNQDLARLKRYPSTPAEARRLASAPFVFSLLGDFVDHYLRSGDEVIGRRISDAALPTMQAAVNLFLNQSALVTMGFAPHHQNDILFATHVADFALAHGNLAPAEVDRLTAQAAFLSYVVHRPDYWSPKRGFAANPNMTSIVAGYQGLLACVLNDHPLTSQWLDASLAELFDSQLLTWSDENGGWLEAPHYAMLSYDHMLGVFACARNLGRTEYLYHPRMKKVIEWFAKISTPPDSRIGNRRHHPPIGNTYMLEPTGQFGTVANLWRDQDPKFAAEMQWMHLQSGAPVMPGVGGFWPATAPYQKASKNPELATQRPDYGSELFPKTGAILRSHFGSDRETQLHVIAGSNHDHYDYDSGSITIWGKGRIIADDFGYYGRAPASDHSMVESKSASGVMQVDAFSAGSDLDMFRGRSGDWTRQIAFLKDSDPLGPNYFVIRDDVGGGQAATWRLWLSAAKVDLKGDRALVVGREDIDTDVVFLSGAPAEARLETISRTSASSFFDKPLATTQTGVIVKLPEAKAGVSVLVYPRLKSEAPPRVQVAMGGRVVHLETASGTETVFLAREPFTYEEGGIAFTGTVGAIKVQGNNRVLTLGSKGRIEAHGRVLESDKPRTLTWTE